MTNEELLARIERRPGGQADRGFNPMESRLLQSGLALLKAGTRCRFCDREATTLIARGTTAACHEHARRFTDHARSKRGF